MFRPLSLLCGLLLMMTAPAQAQSWFQIRGDDGKPVVNMRAPVELTAEIDRLKGVNAIGAANPDVTIVEFADYNCPFCRKAASELEELARSNSSLRVKFVQNSIIGVQSAQAARVVLATFRLAGARNAYLLHQRLYARRGLNDGASALSIARDLKLDVAAIEAAADSDEVKSVLTDHLKLSAELGLSATPSFVINGMEILGYPGKRAMQQIIDSVLKCDAITC